MVTSIFLHFRTTLPTLLLLAGLAACTKPERPLPAGPGLTPEHAAAKVEHVPKVSEEQRTSALTAEQKQLVVARIGDKVITLGDMEARLDAEPPVVKSQFTSAQKRKDYLAKLVQFEVLAAEAQRQGLDKDPEVLEAMRQAMVRKFLMDTGKDEIELKAVSEPDIAAYYQANPGVFHRPEQVELSHILVADKETAEKLRKEIDKASEGNSAKLVQTWNEYVGRYSQDKTTIQLLGALGRVSLEPLPGASPDEVARLQAIGRPIVEAALKTETFSLAPVVQSPEGWHVLLVTSKLPAVNKTLDQARESIRARIVKRERDLRREQLVAELKARNPVEINDAALKLLPPPKPPAGKGAAPAEAATPTTAPAGPAAGKVAP
jgi:peptidyl-prolyl cis-trans isomerase C